MSEYVALSDIHGNAHALQKVVDEEGLDAEYVVLGDIHGLLAQPTETMRLLEDMEPEVLLAGNHDKAIFHHNEGHVASDALSKFELEHTLSKLNTEQQQFMSNLPFMEVWKDGAARIAAAHAKPWVEQASGYEQGNAGVPKGNIPHFASIVADDYDFVLLGHTHEQYDLDCSQFGHPVIFVNPGSLGWDNTYSVVDTESGEVAHKSVKTDTDAIREHIQRLLPEDAPHTSEWF
jgi:predicted phosphodiesterase